MPLYNHTFDFMAWMLGLLARPGRVRALQRRQCRHCDGGMLPATFLAGMTFTDHAAVAAHRMGEKSIGLSAANTVGAIVGCCRRPPADAAAGAAPACSSPGRSTSRWASSSSPGREVGADAASRTPGAAAAAMSSPR
jgi:hypothetical protein